MHRRTSAIAIAVIAVIITACGGAYGQEDEEASGVCADLIEIDGRSYLSRPYVGALPRGEEIGAVSVSDCETAAVVGPPGSADEDGSPVFAISGVEVGTAVLVGRDEVLYVTVRCWDSATVTRCIGADKSSAVSR